MRGWSGSRDGRKEGRKKKEGWMVRQGVGAGIEGSKRE